MTAPEQDIEVVVELGGDGDETYRDGVVRRLLRELRETGFDASLHVDGRVPARAKSAEAMGIASVLVPIMVSAAPKLIELLKEWLTREKGREVTVTTRRQGVVISVVRYEETIVASREG